MCWIGKNVKRIAERDIEVYKVLYKHKDKYVPYFYCGYLAYEVGKLYKQEMNVLNDGIYCEVDAAFHSYSMERTYVKRRDNPFLTTYRIYSKNDESWFDHYYDDKHNTIQVTNKFLSDETIILKEDVHFVKCIIPKGAEYFENEDGEIVSNKIVVTGDEIDKGEFDKFKVDW